MNRAIIVITDGENHEDDAMGAAEQAAELGIKVYTVGMGSPNGGPIPAGGNGNFLRDREGNVVITRLDEACCNKLPVPETANTFRPTISGQASTT